MQDRIEPATQRAVDLVGGTIAAAAPVWMPLIDNVNHVLVLLTSLGGCILVWARVVSLMRRRRHTDR